MNGRLSTMSTKPKNPLASLYVPEALGSPIQTNPPDSPFFREAGIAGDNRRNEYGVPHSASVPTQIRVALVDSFVFTRGCLIEALTTPEHGFAVTAFETVPKLILSDVRDIDIILYYDHEQIGSGVPDTAWDEGIREEFGDVPIIVLSDATAALEPQTVRAALKCGVRGFISTRTFEMRTVSAAIRFVTAGGVFIPVDLLLVDEVKPPSGRNGSAPPDGLLTPRQTTVLSLLQQGKANKIIAFELGMTESTVKVHIRNIMRKMGATNRTQAVYNSQQLGNLPYLGSLNE